MLSNSQVQQFIEDGFVRIDGAFPRQLADQGRAILWRDLPCDPDDPATWTEPLVRLGHYGDAPFEQAVNSAVLYEAFDQLVGTGRWRPRTNLGAFPVRFPSRVDPGDTAWHIDVGFPDDGGSWDDRTDYYSKWRVNITSRGRALLMLFLFSDVSEFDAPTRIRAGSHLDIAPLLEPAGEAGMTPPMFSVEAASHRPEVLATGEAGTVFLCHPFLVHAAQRHRGSTPRFLAQPSLHQAEPFHLDRPDGDYSPAESAIRLALRR